LIHRNTTNSPNPVDRTSTVLQQVVQSPNARILLEKMKTSGRKTPVRHVEVSNDETVKSVKSEQMSDDRTTETTNEKGNENNKETTAIEDNTDECGFDTKLPTLTSYLASTSISSPTNFAGVQTKSLQGAHMMNVAALHRRLLSTGTFDPDCYASSYFALDTIIESSGGAFRPHWRATL